MPQGGVLQPIFLLTRREYEEQTLHTYHCARGDQFTAVSLLRLTDTTPSGA